MYLLRQGDILKWFAIDATGSSRPLQPLSLLKSHLYPQHLFSTNQQSESTPIRELDSIQGLLVREQNAPLFGEHRPGTHPSPFVELVHPSRILPPNARHSPK